MPVPAPPGGAEPQPDALEEVRARLEALDERPLHEHPEQFAAVDRLLRSALDGTAAGAVGQAGVDRAGSR